MSETKTSRFPADLLGPDDPPPTRLMNAAAIERAEVLLLCDHASAVIPQVLGDLGLDAGERARHIAWDIGAAEVTERLVERFDCPAVFSGFSRLVIDCNRQLDDADSIPLASDGTVVPGNHGLTVEDRAARAEACFHPYHRMVAATLDAMTTGGRRPAVIAVHSCTPVMNGVARPWHVGVLWRRDKRIAGPLMAALEGLRDVCVGDNVPYSAHLNFGMTMPTHAEARGLPHALLELRQDLIDTHHGAQAWADVVVTALEPILADPTLTTAPPPGA